MNWNEGCAFPAVFSIASRKSAPSRRRSRMPTAWSGPSLAHRDSPAICVEFATLFRLRGNSSLTYRLKHEGDGYARLRVLFAEARQSVRIMAQALAELAEGSIGGAVQPRAGAALGAVEAPRGATFHWVRLDDGGRIATLPHHYAVVYELAQLQPRRGEIRVPGLSRSFSPRSICPWPRTTDD